MTPKVLLLTSEIKNPSHRGIHAFTKTTFSALKRLGFETSLFTQSLAPNEPDALLPQIVHGLANPRHLEWMPARRTWMGSHYRRRSREIANGAVIWPTEWKWRFLSDVDFFFNSPGFFDAQEFGTDCWYKASNDWAGRCSTHLKRISGEIRGGAIDIDFVREAGYRLIITTSPFPIRSRSGRVKIVQTLHDLIPFEYPYGLENPGKFFHRVKSSLRHADQIISVSNYTSKTLDKALPAFSAKVTTIHQANPIEASLGQRNDANPEMEAAWMSKQQLTQKKYFLYVGALERRKNIETILEAFRSLDPALGLKLVLVGPCDPKYVDQIGLPADLRSTKGSEATVHYLGVVPEHRKIDLLRHASALVFPAVLEGFGLPVVEAMSIGCPVITTRGTSLSEVGGDAVLYLENPGDVLELAALMNRVALDRELSDDLRARGLLRSKDFSIDSYAERLRSWGATTGVFDHL